MTIMDHNQMVIRSFSPEQDIPKLSSLYSAVKAVDHDDNEISEQALRAQLNLPGHDPLKDRWVVEAPDVSLSLIASGVVSVAPSWSIQTGGDAESEQAYYPKLLGALGCFMLVQFKSMQTPSILLLPLFCKNTAFSLKVLTQNCVSLKASSYLQ
jgi:hypothetical protein